MNIQLELGIMLAWDFHPFFLPRPMVRNIFYSTIKFRRTPLIFTTYNVL